MSNASRSLAGDWRRRCAMTSSNGVRRGASSRWQTRSTVARSPLCRSSIAISSGRSAASVSSNSRTARNCRAPAGTPAGASERAPGRRSDGKVSLSSCA
nr:hypothetical protein [Verrucosispora sioxanthis]